MEIVIANILMVIIMLVFSMYIFRNVVKRINQSTKKWFLEQLQGYNYLIEEHEKKLEILRNQIAEAKAQLEKAKQMEKMPGDVFNEKIETVLNRMKSFKDVQTEIPRRPEVVYDIPTPQYRESSFFNNYKHLRKNFKIDTEKIVKEFIEKHKIDEDIEEYSTILNFCNQFNSKNLYECSTLQNELQYELIEEVLTEKDKKWINLRDENIRKSKFTVRGFIEKLEQRIKSLDPTIYIYVGKENTEFEKIDPRIRTYVYKNMSEGVIINYKGKMYDYSI